MSPAILKTRCPWCGDAPDYQQYHDHEWGVPLRDDRLLFEKMVLEGFQSGLSWITILRKRENFRKAFKHFDFRVVAGYGQADIERLVQDAGIVRHRGKIEAAINNAQRTCELVDELGSFSDFVWSFAPIIAVTQRKAPVTMAEVAGQTEESLALSKALKKRGYRFVGPTTMYALMQSAGLVNDHLASCYRRPEVSEH
jgi:DNA-3-methyladenine glycosylase I